MLLKGRHEVHQSHTFSLSRRKLLFTCTDSGCMASKVLCVDKQTNGLQLSTFKEKATMASTCINTIVHGLWALKPVFILKQSTHNGTTLFRASRISLFPCSAKSQSILYIENYIADTASKTPPEEVREAEDTAALQRQEEALDIVEAPEREKSGHGSANKTGGKAIVGRCSGPKWWHKRRHSDHADSQERGDSWWFQSGDIFNKRSSASFLFGFWGDYPPWVWCFCRSSPDQQSSFCREAWEFMRGEKTIECPQYKFCYAEFDLNASGAWNYQFLRAATCMHLEKFTRQKILDWLEAEPLKNEYGFCLCSRMFI